MKFLSLFSGIEACSVAWKSLGWQCVGFSEIEPFPCSVLQHHYPNVPNLGDVTKITEQQIADLGEFDVLVFGSPCQDLSVAGTRMGFQDGTRSNLFYEALRIFDYARKHNNCRFALWENVPGAFSSNKGADFTAVVREMAGLQDITTPANGWGNTGAALGENGLLEWRVLDAQYFGLAQRRKRVFAILDTGDWFNRPPILFERESVRGNTPPSREAGESIAKGTQISTVRESSFGTFVNSETAGTTKASGGVLGGGSESLVVVHGTQDPITSETTANCLGRNSGQENVVIYQKPVFFAEPRRARGVDIVGFFEPCPTLQAYAGTGGGNTPMVAHKVISVAGNIIGRSPQNGQDQNLLHNSIIRRLTPVECERLQGFPDNYTQIPYRNKSADQCPDSPRYKALGNSMAVPVMQWIGKQIQQAVKDKLNG